MLLPALIRPSRINRTVSSAEENLVTSTFQRLFNNFDTGDSTEHSEPHLDGRQQPFQQPSKIKRLKKLRNQVEEGSHVPVGLNMPGGLADILFLVFALTIGKRIQLFKQRWMSSRR